MSQIVVMARWPSPGRCKRRLSRDLAQGLGLRQAPERAMRIQRRLTGHTASVVTAIEDELLRPPVLAVSGLGQRGALRWGRQLGISVVRQQGHGNLGCRLKRQLLQSLQARNTERVGIDVEISARLTLLESFDAEEIWLQISRQTVQGRLSGDPLMATRTLKRSSNSLQLVHALACRCHQHHGGEALVQ